MILKINLRKHLKCFHRKNKKFLIKGHPTVIFSKRVREAQHCAIIFLMFNLLNTTRLKNIFASSNGGKAFYS
jgi:hypothetical protein